MTDVTANPSIDELKATQRNALDASGWGTGFKLLQPRNPCFWILILGIAYGTVQTIQVFQPFANNYGNALAVGAIGFSIYTIPWLLFLRHKDRYTTLPPRLLGTGFAWGATAATMWIAITVNGSMLSLYAKLFGQQWASGWAPGFTAPFTEEFAKGAGIVLLIGLAPRLIRSAFDGFVVGAFVGLGFQIAEDILYAVQSGQAHFGTGQTASAVQIIVLRGVTGAFSHAMYSALVGMGLVWIIGTASEARNLERGIPAVLAAMTFHFFWDNGAAVGNSLIGAAGFFVVMPIVMIVSVLTLRHFVNLASKREEGWMHDILAPEVTYGTLWPAEMDAIAGNSKARRSFVKSQTSHHDRKRAKHVLEGATDLAAAIAQGHGDETEMTAHHRAAIAGLRDGA